MTPQAQRMRYASFFTITIFSVMLASSCHEEIPYMLEAPELVSPPHKAILDGASITFDWQAAPNADHYVLMLNDRPVETTQGLTATITDLPPSNRPYCWFVRAATNYQYFPSATRCFRVVDPNFTVISPIAESDWCGDDVVFSWKGVVTAIGYLIELRDADGNVVWTTTSTSPTYKPDAPLPPGNYVWVVSPIFQIGNSEVLGSPSPLTPFSVSPSPVLTIVDNATELSFCKPAGTYTFNWTADLGGVTDVTVDYKYELRSADGETLFTSGTTQDTTVTLDLDLASWDTIFRVRGIIASCLGNWTVSPILHVNPPPTLPTFIESEIRCHDDSLFLMWQDAQNAASYDLEVWSVTPGYSETFLDVTSPKTIPLVGTLLPSGRGDYGWRVTVNGFAPCTSVTTADQTTFVDFPPVPPTTMSATNACQGDDVVFTFSGQDRHDQINIKIEGITTGASCMPACTVNNITSPYTHSGLLPGEYRFQLEATPEFSDSPCDSEWTDWSSTFYVKAAGELLPTTMYWYRRATDVTCFASNVTADYTTQNAPLTLLEAEGYTVIGDTLAVGSDTSIPTGDVLVINDGPLLFNFWDFAGKIIVTRDSGLACMFYQMFDNAKYLNFWRNNDSSLNCNWVNPPIPSEDCASPNSGVWLDKLPIDPGYTEGDWNITWEGAIEDGPIYQYYEKNSDFASWASFKIRRISDGREWCWIHHGPSDGAAVPARISHENFVDKLDYAIRNCACAPVC